MDATFEALNLSNIGEGELDAQVQDALVQVSEIFETAERYERTKDGTIHASIVITIDLDRQEDQAMVGLDFRTVLKRPKLRRIGRTILYQAGAFAVPKLKQAELFPAVRPIRAHTSEPQE